MDRAALFVPVEYEGCPADHRQRIIVSAAFVCSWQETENMTQHLQIPRLAVVLQDWLNSVRSRQLRS